MQRKTVLITGASSDIGIGIIRKLLAAECHVYGQYFSNKHALNEFVDDNNFVAIQQNLDTPEQALELVRNVVKNSEVLDVLINAIGPLHHKPLHELTSSEWQHQIHFNLNLAFYLTHYARDYLIKAQGHIINFAFAGAETLSARSNDVPYCIAKAGIITLTKSLAKDLASHGVRVNAISPGLIELGSIQSAVRQKMADHIPVGHPGTPDDVAQVLMWLLFSSPAYVTGALVPVAGGWEHL